MDPLPDIADLIPPHLVHKSRTPHQIMQDTPLPQSAVRTPTIINSLLLYWTDNYYNSAGGVYKQIIYHSTGIVFSKRYVLDGRSHGVYIEYDEDGVQIEHTEYKHDQAAENIFNT